MDKQPDHEVSRTSSTKGYRELEFAIIGDLKKLRDIAERLGAEADARQVEGVLKDIEQHSFKIAVVGEFKRGKSTFINALLGKEILPSDILPASATLNRVTYGLEPRIQVYFKSVDSQPPRVEEIAFDQLAKYVTKLTPEAEAIAATVAEAVVHYPVPYCKNNVDIIDTPGLSDEAAMTEVTLSVLPNVHAAIMVIMADVPFAETESKFLDHILQQGLGQVIFVVTAMDRISRNEDRPRLLEGIARRITNRLQKMADAQFGDDFEERQRYIDGVGQPRIFGVSGYLALQAKISGDEQMRADSGFTQLEEALYKFVTEESGLIALQSWLNHITVAGKRLLEYLNRQASLPNATLQQIESALLVELALIETVRQIGQQELVLIDLAEERAKSRVIALLRTLEGEFVSTCSNTVKNAPLKLADLENIQAAKGQLGRQMFDAVQQKGRTFATSMHKEVLAEMETERERLKEFALVICGIDQHLSGRLQQLQVANLNLPPIDTTTLLVQCATPEVAGYENAVGLPFKWVNDAVRDINVSPDQAAGWVTRKLSDVFKVDNFKTQLSQQGTASIKAILEAQPLDPLLTVLIVEVFNGLKQAIENSLDQLKEKLALLRNHRERVALWCEHENRDLQDLGKQILVVLNNARELRNAPGGTTAKTNHSSLLE
jgi:GTP-binding protein EngB required for normal cell division